METEESWLPSRQINNGIKAPVKSEPAVRGNAGRSIMLFDRLGKLRLMCAPSGVTEFDNYNFL